MHLASLKTYLHVRDVVVSYLQAKRVWTPNATYAGSTARKDPNAMDIGKIGAKVEKVKRGMEKERMIRAKEEKTNTAKEKENHPRMIKKRMTKRDVLSVGRPAILLTNAGLIPRVMKRARLNHKSKCPM